MTREKLVLSLAIIFALLLLGGMRQAVYAQDASAAKGGGGSDTEKGFKVGKLILHPGLSLQNVYDTNVTNASEQYPDKERQPTADDSLHLIGAFKMHYPSEVFAFTLDTQLAYVRYFGIEDPDTTQLSALTANGRVAVAIYKNAIFGATVKNAFTRAVDPSQVGVVHTSDRIHNQANLRLHLKPGGGQLRFFAGYTNDWEKYDEGYYKNQNWLQHEIFLDWELEFLPKTAFFMSNKFQIRDYYEFKKEKPARTNSEAPNSMPLKILAGLMGRITKKLLINVSVGYGNSFAESDKLESFNSAIAKVEVTGQFTSRTSLKGGFERDFAPVTTFSYTVDNKAYAEFKQWLVNDQLKLNAYFSFTYIQFGQPDKGVDLIDNDVVPGTKTPAFTPPAERSDMLVTFTPSVRYDPLKWLFLEAGYTMTMRITDYKMEIYDIAPPTNPITKLPMWNKDEPVGVTYYDYLKHMVFFKLTFSY